MAYIKLQNVSVNFPIYDSSTRSFKSRILPGKLGGKIGTLSGHVAVVEALRDISFCFNHGDRVGLIGHNGAGKTTMLRVLAGIYEPSLGDILREGQVAPLFDIFLGMDAEATGYENIYLRGLFLGMTHQEIKGKLDEIAVFTELDDFLHLPLRTYSAGMRMRLAFAVSTSINPDILLLDEGISAGDSAFMEKAEKRLAKFAERAGIIVLASHSNVLIKKLCKSAILMKQGQIAMTGAVDEVLDRYSNSL